MFGAGWTEMLIIGVVALVVIGPKDLPVVMRKLGRMVATVRRMGSEFQNEINKTTGLDQITDLRRSITEPLRQTSQEIAQEFNRLTPTGVEPSGIMKPTDPKVESVYDQITAAAGVEPTEVAAAPAAVESAPAAPASKPKRASKAAGKRAAASKTAAVTATGAAASTAPKRTRKTASAANAGPAAPVETAAMTTSGSDAPVAPVARGRRVATKTVASAQEPAVRKAAPRARAKKA